MISHILYSEFVLNKKTLYFFFAMVIAIAVIYPLLFDVPPGVTLTISAIYLSFLPVSFLAKQSKFKADATMCVLPVTRNMLVLGKYVFTMILFLIGLALFVLIFLVLPGSKFSLADGIDAYKLVNVAFAVGVVSSVLIPLIIRFGYMGVLGFILGANILTVVIFLLTYLKLINNALSFIIEGVPSAFNSFRDTLGTPGYHLLMLCATALIWCGSLKLSQALYTRKEL